MKKIYKKPSVKEVNLNACTLLAGSVTPDGMPVNPSEDTDNMESKGSIWYWMGEEN